MMFTQRLYFYWLLTLATLVSLLILTPEHTLATHTNTNTTDTTAEEDHKKEREELYGERCLKRRITVNITYPGCGSVTTKVNYCTGSCLSYVVPSLYPPYVIQEFRCCVAQEIHIKIRRKKFPKCIGEDGRVSKTRVEKKIFFPFFDKCNCVDPIALLQFTIK